MLVLSMKLTGTDGGGCYRQTGGGGCYRQTDEGGCYKQTDLCVLMLRLQKLQKKYKTLQNTTKP